MKRDCIDVLLAQWRAERPDLNPEPMGVVGRILQLALHLQNRMNEGLKPHGLALWGFDVLATLRRHGEPFAMTPTELTRSVLLSSGAMTNRIDRLEKLGFVKRQPDPRDRRSLLVQLTAKGRKVVDGAVGCRFDEAEDAIRVLSASERRQMASLLRKILLHLDPSTT